MVSLSESVADAVADPGAHPGAAGLSQRTELSAYGAGPSADCAPSLWDRPLRADPWVRELFRLSQTMRPVRSRPAEGPVPTLTTTQPAVNAAAYRLEDMAPQLANPLAPLRDRDRQALNAIFAHDQMAAIEADILQRLSYLFPEPAWETEPYEFLREFL